MNRGKNESYILKEISATIPPISSFSSRNEWKNFCRQKILKSKKLLQLLITLDEQNDLVVRAAALKGILSGKSYREISKEFFVSLQTINAVRKGIDENGYRSYSERSRKEKRNSTHNPSPVRIKQGDHKRSVRTKYGRIYVSY